ncbi:von Willebrand factor D and EGF domain-containing protein [Cetorhinus maximus]
MAGAAKSAYIRFLGDKQVCRIVLIKWTSKSLIPRPTMTQRCTRVQASVSSSIDYSLGKESWLQDDVFYQAQILFPIARGPQQSCVGTLQPMTMPLRTTTMPRPAQIEAAPTFIHTVVASTCAEVLYTPIDGECLVLLLLGLCEARSKASRGVVVPFVFDPKAKCDPPCQHVGLCIRNNTCFCSKGYEGDLCQYVTCYPKCKNGGECLRPGKCRCPPGVRGRYCHKATCDGGCLNGGECISVNSVVKCLCSSGWMGSRCQEAICPQGCRNGGSCLAPGICNCQDGWVGGACHLAVCDIPCVHGGKCIAPNVCRCRGSYTGPQCKQKKNE